jgi:hypothetical protein
MCDAVKIIKTYQLKRTWLGTVLILEREEGKKYRKCADGPFRSLMRFSFGCPANTS